MCYPRIWSYTTPFLVSQNVEIGIDFIGSAMPVVDTLFDYFCYKPGQNILSAGAEISDCVRLV